MKKQKKHRRTPAHERREVDAHDGKSHEPHEQDDAQTTNETHHREPPRDEPAAPLSIDEELRQIYAIDDTNKTETKKGMSKLEIVTQPVVRRVLVVVLLVLIAIAAGLTGSLLLNQPFTSSPKDALAFEVLFESAEITSGTLTTVTIPYRNPASIPLADLEIIVHLPDAFVVESVAPEASQTAPYTFRIGTIEPGAEGEIVFSGRFFGAVQTAHTVQTIMRYKPANFSSHFEDIASQSVLIKDSAYRVSLGGPDRVVPEEEQTYTVEVSRTEEGADVPLELTLSVPNTFVLGTSNREPDHEDALRWTIESVPVEEPIVFSFTGYFTSSGAKKEEIIAAALAYVQDDTRHEQSRVELPTEVLSSELSLSLVAGGGTSRVILLPGDDLTLNVTLSNTGEETAEDIRVELRILEGENRLDVAARSGIPDGRREGSVITWDGDDLSRLATLRGTESASIDMAIPLRESGEDTIVLQAEATVSSIGGIEAPRTITSNRVTIRVASDLQALSSARYFDSEGFAVGQGPIPPLAGSRTTYRVTWTLSGGVHDVQDLTMSAPIPERAQWGGVVSVSRGSLGYDPVAGRVRWTLDRLPPSDTPPIAVFDMHVEPNASDVGSFVEIIGAARVNGYDNIAGTSVSADAPAQTTELPNDPQAEGQGAVME